MLSVDWNVTSASEEWTGVLICKNVSMWNMIMVIHSQRSDAVGPCGSFGIGGVNIRVSVRHWLAKQRLERAGTRAYRVCKRPAKGRDPAERARGVGGTSAGRDFARDGDGCVRI